ncbi:MAG: hypothetical protein ABJB34_03170 [Acidobacteriota bacterium]
MGLSNYVERPLRSFGLVTILVVCSSSPSCLNPGSRAAKTNDIPPVQNLAAEYISRLRNDIIVRFPAVLVNKPGSDCIELFAQDDFNKYRGDGKFAIFSTFEKGRVLPQFAGSRKGVITGKMTFVRDVPDTTKTCGIVTGQLFEISEVE